MAEEAAATAGRLPPGSGVREGPLGLEDHTGKIEAGEGLQAFHRWGAGLEAETIPASYSFRRGLIGANETNPGEE